MRNSIRRTVTRIIDGDTFEVARVVGKFYKIRLANVNAPPIHTLNGQQAMRVLRGMIGGRIVTIIPLATSYDRVVSEVFADGRSVNKRMKQRGY